MIDAKRPDFQSSTPAGTPRSTGYAQCDPPKEPAVKPPKRMGSLSEAEEQAQHARLVQTLIDQRKKQDQQDKAEHARAASTGKDLGKESQ